MEITINIENLGHGVDIKFNGCDSEDVKSAIKSSLLKALSDVSVEHTGIKEPERKVAKKRCIQMLGKDEDIFYPQLETPNGDWVTLPNPKSGGDLIYDNLDSAMACLDAIPDSEYIIHNHVKKTLAQV